MVQRENIVMVLGTKIIYINKHIYELTYIIETHWGDRDRWIDR